MSDFDDVIKIKILLVKGVDTSVRFSWFPTNRMPVPRYIPYK